MRVVRSWHKMPREAVDVQSLEVFKARLEQAVEQTGLVVGVSAHGRGVETRWSLRSLPKPFWDSVKIPAVRSQWAMNTLRDTQCMGSQSPLQHSPGAQGSLVKGPKNTGPLAERLLLETRSLAPSRPLLQQVTGALGRERQALENQSQEKK